MDRIEALRTFVRVMETGSFSQTADDMDLGQPAVSKRIALLEREFNCQLFARTTRKLHPTPDADRIHQIAKEILATYERAGAANLTPEMQPGGTLRMTAPTSFGRYFFSALFAEYMRRYPDVRLNVHFTEDYVDLVGTGAELAVRIGLLNSSTLIARRVGTIRRILVATPDFMASHPEPRVPDHLRPLPCITYSRMSPSNQWTFESDSGRHVVDTQSVLNCDDADIMTEAVLMGLGLGILPSWCAAPHLATGRLVQVLPEFTVPPLPVHVVYPNTQWMTHRARLFRDLMIERGDMFNLT